MGKRTERGFDPLGMWVTEDKDELKLLYPQSSAVSLLRLERIVPPPLHLQIWVLSALLCQHLISKAVVFKLTNLTNCHVPLYKV